MQIRQLFVLVMYPRMKLHMITFTCIVELSAISCVQGALAKVRRELSPEPTHMKENNSKICSKVPEHQGLFPI
jgi:hypothetical protein